jgi:hypothetical protein
MQATYEQHPLHTKGIDCSSRHNSIAYSTSLAQGSYDANLCVGLSTTSEGGRFVTSCKVYHIRRSNAINKMSL